MSRDDITAEGTVEKKKVFFLTNFVLEEGWRQDNSNHQGNNTSNIINTKNEFN